MTDLEKVGIILMILVSPVIWLPTYDGKSLVSVILFCIGAVLLMVDTEEKTDG